MRTSLEYLEEPQGKAWGFGLWARAAALAALGAGAGLVYNALSAKGIPLRTPASVSASDYVNWNLYVKHMRVALPEAKAAFDRKAAIFVDVRTKGAYDAGHIPGALHLMSAEVRTRARELLGEHPRDARIITYCSGGRCQSSLRMAMLLTDELGFTNVGAFYEGWEVWTAAGYPIAKEEAP